MRRAIRRPPGHWLLLALTMTALGTALLLQGFSSEQLGSSSSRSQSAPVAGLADVGPILDLSGPAVLSVAPTRRRVALTFDDGPDPTWTPQVLAVLRRYHVPATFFMVGSRIQGHSAVVNAVLRDGHEIGSHTFTHADLGRVSGIRANLELSLTETALAGTSRINTSLVRLPYSSTASDFSPDSFRAARAAGRVGYLVVAATEDGEDWRRPGVDRIVANAMPPDGQGGIVLLHDGGGDRAQTVAALDRLIPALQGEGYRFETVSEIAGLAPGSTTSTVGGVAHLQGVGLSVLIRFSSLFTGVLSALLVPLGLLSILRGIVVLALAHRHVRLVAARTEPAFLPAVSVIVPAYNEEVGIAAAVRSLAASAYPELEIIVIDDGSTDRTAEIVAALALPRVSLITQANVGKPAALNSGLAAAHHEVIVMVDGDTVFEPDTVHELVQPFADPRVGAVSGNTKVGNRRGILGRWQHVEYVIGFNLDRRMYDTLRCMPTVPGAIGAFRRQALVAVGGVSGDTLAEDTDLTMAVNRAGWRVVYEERARAWTEAPASLGALWRQRYRWCYGTMQAMWKHRGALGERGPLGRYGLPYLLLFQVLLPLLAPVIDLFAAYGLLFLDPGPVIAYWVSFNVLQLAMGIYAFRLDGERLGPLWVVPLQQFVYRQLMYLVLIQSVFSAAVGARLRWQTIRRTGLDPGLGEEALASRGG